MALTLDSVRKGVSLTWDETAEAGYPEVVTVYAIGAKGDVHNKAPQLNNGKAGLFYPAGFSGTSRIEVRSGEEIIVSGEISV